MGDIDLLVEMGFDRPRAELALKKAPGGDIAGAIQWLEDNQDKPLEELQGPAKTAGDAAEEPAGEGDGARSWVCKECDKKFRTMPQLEFHAHKTGHSDFEESTEEVAPLTEEEKAAKLQELREKLKEKKASQSVLEREEQKKNEKIRQKATKESEDAKEELQRKEQIKEAAKKRQEKRDDLEAKKRIKAKIEADKEERRRKAEQAKAARGGYSAEPAPAAAAAPAPAPVVAKATAEYAEARLRIQTPQGNVQRSFPVETTLFEIAQAIQAEKGVSVSSFSMTFPKKVFEGDVDFSKTLKEAGLVPSAVLIAK